MKKCQTCQHFISMVMERLKRLSKGKFPYITNDKFFYPAETTAKSYDDVRPDIVTHYEAGGNEKNNSHTSFISDEKVRLAVDRNCTWILKSGRKCAPIFDVCFWTSSNFSHGFIFPAVHSSNRLARDEKNTVLIRSDSR
jgi:hypothetical protein